jgi:uncharacterized membrane protein HdeD (DUF308 family)
MSWKLRMGLGAVLLAIGAVLLLLAVGETVLFFTVILPSLVLILGLLTIVEGVRGRDHKERAGREIVRGGMLAGAGLVLFVLWKLYLVLILLVLMVWFFSSAAVTLLRVVRERRRLTKGFWYTLGLGLSSLALGILAIVLPDELVEILLALLAGLVLVAGAFTLLDAWGLRNAARLMEEGDSA